MAEVSIRAKLEGGEQLTSGLQSLQKSLGNLSASWLGVGLGVAGVTTAFAAFLKSGINTAAELSNVSQKIGVSVESLSTLKFAAQQSNLSFEQLTFGLRMLSRQMSEARQASGDVREAFKAVGLSAEELKTLSPEDTLLRVAERFAQLADGSEKTAIAIRLFGRSGTELIPFLNQGRDGLERLREEARKLGLEIKNETAAAADAFQNNVAALTSAVRGASLALAEHMVPTLARVTESFRDGVREGSILKGLLEGIAKLSPASSDIWKAEREIVQLTDELLSTQNEILRRRAVATKEEMDALEEHAAKIKQRLEEVIRLKAMLAGEEPGAAKGAKKEQLQLPPTDAELERQRKAAQELRALALERVAVAVAERTKEIEDQKALVDEQLALITKQRSAVKEGSAEAQALEKEELSLRKQRLGLDEEITKRYLEHTDLKLKAEEEFAVVTGEVQALMMKEADQRIKKLEEVEIVEGNLIKLEGDEKIRVLEAMAEEYLKMGDAGVAAFTKIKDKIKETATTAQLDAKRMEQAFGRAGFEVINVFSGVQRSLESAFAGILKGTSSLSDGLKNIWRGIADAIIAEIARILARWVTAQLFMAAASALSGTALGGLFGAAAGGAGAGAAGGSLFGSAAGGAAGGGLFAGLFGSGAPTTTMTAGGATIGGGVALAPVAAPAATALAAEGGAAAGGAAAGGGAGLGVAAGIAAVIAIPYLLFSKADVAGRSQARRQGLIDFYGEDVIRRVDLADESARRVEPTDGDGLRVRWDTPTGLPYSSAIFGFGGPIMTREQALAELARIGFQAGGESIVTRPTLIRVGEVGAERVTVRPLAGAAHNVGGGNMVLNFNGPTVMDAYTMRLFVRQLKNLMRLDRR